MPVPLDDLFELTDLIRSQACTLLLQPVERLLDDANLWINPKTVIPDSASFSTATICSVETSASSSTFLLNQENAPKKLTYGVEHILHVTSGVMLYPRQVECPPNLRKLRRISCVSRSRILVCSKIGRR